MRKRERTMGKEGVKRRGERAEREREGSGREREMGAK